MPGTPPIGESGAICPLFLMDLHIGLVCAVPNALWLEYIPQLDPIAASRLKIENGLAHASAAPGSASIVK